MRNILLAGLRRAPPAAAGVLALWWASAGGWSAAASPDLPTIVMARDFMFAPASITVKAGSTVTWTNKDDEPHTVVSDTGLFRSAALDTGESFSLRFDKAGTYRYTCSIHPRMVGTIVVQ